MRPFMILAATGVMMILAGFISPVSTGLSDRDKEGLLLMREEEKMAFEVYSAMYRKWDHHVFDNIRKSESFHGDLVKNLIVKYNLEDPYMAAEGAYKNVTLQKMYNDLVKKGELSLTDAFEAGAMIEDLDIFDLEKLVKQTENKDVKDLYETLLSGSRNHLRAFAKQLKIRDKSYEPSYLSRENFLEITESAHESCGYAKDGKGNGPKGTACCVAADKTNCTTGRDKNACGGNQNGFCCAGKKGKKACAGQNAGF